MGSSILIISDDIVFPMYFKNCRYIIDVISNFENIDFINNHKLNRYDIIILDGSYSKSPCIEIIQNIRLIDNTAIWFFPEITKTNYIQKSYLLGVTRIISKPFNPENTSNEIAEYINKKTQLSHLNN